jgi:hypothetical protein
MTSQSKIYIVLVLILLVIGAAFATVPGVLKGSVLSTQCVPAPPPPPSTLYMHNGQAVSVVVSQVPSVVISNVTSAGGTSQVASMVVSSVASSVPYATPTTTSPGTSNVRSSISPSILQMELSEYSAQLIREVTGQDPQPLTAEVLRAAEQRDYMMYPSKYNPSWYERNRVVDIYMQQKPELFVPISWKELDPGKFEKILSMDKRDLYNFIIRYIRESWEIGRQMRSNSETVNQGQATNEAVVENNTENKMNEEKQMDMEKQADLEKMMDLQKKLDGEKMKETGNNKNASFDYKGESQNEKSTGSKWFGE